MILNPRRIGIMLCDIMAFVLGFAVVLVAFDLVLVPKREFQCRMTWRHVGEYGALVELCRIPDTREALLKAERSDRVARGVECFANALGDYK